MLGKVKRLSFMVIKIMSYQTNMKTLSNIPDSRNKRIKYRGTS